MHLRTLCATQAKQIPTKLKTPLPSHQLMAPELRYSFKLQGHVTFDRCSTPSFGVLTYLCVASQMLPIRGCLPNSRTIHCPRDLVVPWLILSCAAEAATSFPSARPRSVFLLAAPPATLASIWAPAVCRHATETKAAIKLRLPADPAGSSCRQLLTASSTYLASAVGSMSMISTLTVGTR